MLGHRVRGISAVLLAILSAGIVGAQMPGRVWTRFRVGTAYAQGYNVVQDSHSNVYVVGYVAGPIDGQTNSPAGDPEVSSDALLIKWDANGTWQWTRIWGHTNAPECAYAVAADGTTFVYVVGGASTGFDGQAAQGDADAFITKWRWDGTKEWTRIWGSANADEAMDVAVNAHTDVLVCGYTAGAFGEQTNAGGNDLFLTKFDPAGNIVWSKIWGSSGNDDASGIAVLDDTDRSAYVVGRAAGSMFGQAYLGNGDMCLSLWSTVAGRTHLWTRLWGSTNYDSALGRVAATTSGVAVAGLTKGAFDGQSNPARWEAACVSYWTSGPTRAWSRIFGPTNSACATGVGLGEGNRIYVSGIAQGPFNGWSNAPAPIQNLFLCAFDASGSSLWTRIWGCVSNNQEEGRCHVLGDRVAVAFCGYSGFDGQDVGSDLEVGKAGVSLYDADYEPTAASASHEPGGDVIAWNGAWDCAFLFEGNTDLPGGGWATNAGLPGLPGAERLWVTNDASANPRFYRACARPLHVLRVFPPDGMVRIPGGLFVMGAPGIAEPVHTNNISEFWMDPVEVSKSQWDEVRTWGAAHGYTFENIGGGKATNHPVHSVDWYNVVKWANARSEMNGRTPCYYTDDSLGTNAVYRSGRLDLSNSWVNWSADGYRLPTEAEWEKAARGGLAGYLFPWGGDTITHTQANYNSTNIYPYDVSATRGFHPSYTNGGFPYTAPVGSFATNGYGLYDMAGNVGEWIWDWYDAGYYAVSPTNDPRGPATGTYRCWRSGTWHIHAPYARVAHRNFFLGGPGGGDDTLGFRCVRRGP